MIDYRKAYIVVMPNYLMTFIRKKRIKGRPYYYIVKSWKKDGRVKQKVLYYIGTAERLLQKLGIKH